MSVSSNSESNELAVIVTPVSLPWISTRPFVVTVKDILSADECHTLLSSSAVVHCVASVNVGGGRHEIETNFRKSYQCDLFDYSLASFIFNRLTQKSILPLKFRGHTLAGVSPRVHFLRYLDGGFFLPHRDGHYMLKDEKSPLDGCISLITIQLYLNSTSESNHGQTKFMDPKHPDTSSVSISPLLGSCVIFDSSLYHEGCTFTATDEVQHKDTVRMEVLYRPNEYKKKKTEGENESDSGSSGSSDRVKGEDNEEDCERIIINGVVGLSDG